MLEISSDGGKLFACPKALFHYFDILLKTLIMAIDADAFELTAKPAVNEEILLRMKSFNDLHIITGVVTEEIKTEKTKTGKTVANFSLAVDKSYGKDGEWIERTRFYRAAAWNEVAEAMEKRIRKGDLITVRGDIDCEAWQSGAEIKTQLTCKILEFDLVRRGRAKTTADGGDGDETDSTVRFEAEDNVFNVR